ncbi:hypothetical protein Gbth_017_035 [Gluconobacter thailandicus F149-1 = NBRC 100600]|uniref:DUF892 family protein n=1 Tax=Gluconobacter thailandicus NBRC 3257 TaxID=1381097 RepID=A0ABQ0IVT0_GLUTH|nr:DUF892 family protein [Gluconobacter thailandicus]AFW00734.1 hypothetical protein B932_1149 [Gluconobacter oxydans H24]ANQ40575.1 hypothetical protein BAR24_03295 [Gluconobacter oxydans]KXV53455.1 hypothetical protein AD946_07685 [Gluconobacter thailandicus]GAC87737.1 hypothetical protein NBRC3255_1398 [Gluconobacter thailandicus NBRC 3255]GAD26316.1 hypothetical protein NBRC3257_1315 [Gluconobacter thailandicus NBRC 3257]
MVGRTKSAEKTVLDVYLERLQDHLAIETKTIETVLSELPGCARYESLSAQMKQDLTMRRAHADEIRMLLGRHGHPAPAAHETVSSILNTVSNVLHGGEESSFLKSILTDISYRSYQIASLDILIFLANRLGFASDLSTLERLRTEENTSMALLHASLPDTLAEYLSND